jgi:hypothetical protein
MNDTASFSSRSNAKRAAEKLIANGTAPAVDYGFKTREDGRFEIVWKTAEAKTSPTTGEVEAELAAACEQAETSWSDAGEADAASMTETTSTEPPTPDGSEEEQTAAQADPGANGGAMPVRRTPHR